MLFKNIDVLTKDFDVHKNQYVAIYSGVIKYIGSDLPPGYDGEQMDGRGKLLMPGFVNSHAHSPMSLMRGYGENMILQDWLTNRIFPFEDRLTGEDVYNGTLLSMAESIRNGIVSTTDMYYFCPDMIRAASDAGCKLNVSRALAGYPADGSIDDYPCYSEARRLYADFHGACDGRIRVDMSLHAEYTSNERLVCALSDLAGEFSAPVHVHISETKSEHEQCMARHNGMTPTEYLDSLGLFEHGGIAPHCVWITENDARIMKKRGVTAVTCPVSNLKLASGAMNAPLLMKHGVNIAIGTDSTASNNSLSMLEEIKLFSILSKERFADPTIITPTEALYAATKAGFAAQGRQDSGSIEVGNRADLIVIDTTSPGMNPVHNMKNNIVYSAGQGDIILTMVDGKVLYDRGEYTTIDIEKVIYFATKSSERILGELNATND